MLQKVQLYDVNPPRTLNTHRNKVVVLNCTYNVGNLVFDVMPLALEAQGALRATTPTEALAFLVERVAKMNLVDDNDKTPLGRAHTAYCNSIEIATLLMSKGVKRVSELEAST